MERAKLNDAIRAELEARQLSQGMFADRLGVTSPTLRTWLHRNCFPRVAVRTICNVLSWTLSDEQLQLQYDFDWARPTRTSILYEADSLRSAFITADRESDRIASTMTVMSDMVAKLCARMGKRDLLIQLTATVTPWEMERHIGKEMRDAIIDGVHRGGTYLYLRPDDTQITKYMGDPWHFDRIPTKDKCDNEIKSFRHLIVRELQARGMDEAEAKDRAWRATPQYHVQDNLPFLVPGFIIMMFRAGGHPGDEKDRLIVRLPDNAWATIYLTSADYFHDRFRRTVCEALDVESKRLQKKGEDNDKDRSLKGESLRSAKADLARDQEVLDEIKHLMTA